MILAVSLQGLGFRFRVQGLGLPRHGRGIPYGVEINKERLLSWTSPTNCAPELSLESLGCLSQSDLLETGCHWDPRGIWRSQGGHEVPVRYSSGS